MINDALYAALSFSETIVSYTHVYSQFLWVILKPHMLILISL